MPDTTARHLVTLDEAIRTMTEIVEKRGRDYVYDEQAVDVLQEDRVSCHYANLNGSPSCAVGHYFQAVDPTLYRELVAFEIRDGVLYPHPVSPSQLINFRIHNSEVDYTLAAVDFLTGFQGRQDMLYPWGHVLDRSIASARDAFWLDDTRPAPVQHDSYTEESISRYMATVRATR